MHSAVPVLQATLTPPDATRDLRAATARLNLGNATYGMTTAGARTMRPAVRRMLGVWPPCCGYQDQKPLSHDDPATRAPDPFREARSRMVVRPHRGHWQALGAPRRCHPITDGQGSSAERSGSSGRA